LDTLKRVPGVVVKGKKVLVPCINRDDMTDEQRRAYVIADNRLAELAGWDMDLVKQEMGELMALKGYDVDLTGFDQSLLDYKVGDDLTAEELAEEVEESRSVIAFKDTGDLTFPGEGIYDLPPIRKDRLLDLSKIKRLDTWAGPNSEDRGADLWFYNFNSDSHIGLDWKQTLMGFYVDDARFECWWDDPGRYCGRFLQRGLYGLIGPNFSTFDNWPKAERIFQVYKSRFVTRYMQEAGLRVIPDVEGVPDDLEWVCEGLKGIKTLSVQCHVNFDTQHKLKVQKQIYSYMMDELKPDTLLVYAPPDRLKLFPMLSKARVILVEPRTKVRQRRTKANEE
jgi:hypothetical protein